MPDPETLAGIIETFEARLERMEDKYLELKEEITKIDKNLNVQIAVLNTKFNVLGAIGTITLGATVSVLIAVLFHV